MPPLIMGDPIASWQAWRQRSRPKPSRAFKKGILKPWSGPPQVLFLATDHADTATTTTTTTVIDLTKDEDRDQTMTAIDLDPKHDHDQDPATTNMKR